MSTQEGDGLLRYQQLYVESIHQIGPKIQHVAYFTLYTQPNKVGKRGKQLSLCPIFIFTSALRSRSFQLFDVGRRRKVLVQRNWKFLHLRSIILRQRPRSLGDEYN